jgi:hypothetical protein
MAIIPGAVVHGAGHMYAGSWLHGLGLLALEGGCVYEGFQVLDRNNFASIANQTKGGQIPTNLSGASTDTGIALVCGLGFLWSWFDDMAGSTVAVGEYNKLQDQAAAGQHAQLRLMPAPGGAMLALSTRF